jgi:hypothetical protein
MAAGCRSIGFAFAAWAALAGVSASAAAQAGHRPTCGRAGRPWVSVAFTGEGWPRELKTAVLADLRAGLQLRGIEACTLGSDGSEPPLALLELEAVARDRIAVNIEVHDALTEKRVVRDADLHAVSADARALAIAAAADELLRASWAELALSDAPEPPRPPPPEVQRALQTSLQPARIGSLDHRLGLQAALESYTGGLTFVGGDLVFDAWPNGMLGAELSFGLRQGLRRHAPDGTLESRALTGALDVRFALLPPAARFTLGVKLGVAVSSIGVHGVDLEPDALSNRGDAWDVHARVRLSAAYALWPAFALRADAGVGAPLHSVEATDDGRTIASTSGLQVLAAVGAEARF